MDSKTSQITSESAITHIAVPINEYEHLKRCEQELITLREKMINSLRNSMFNRTLQSQIALSIDCANAQPITDIFKTL